MPVAVVLLVWFALSLSVALTLGRIVAAADAREPATLPVRPSGRGLVRN